MSKVDAPAEKSAVGEKSAGPAAVEPQPVATSQPDTVTSAPPAPGTAPTGEKTLAGQADGGEEVGRVVQTDILRGPNGEIYPTAEELLTLRPVKGKIGWVIYTIAIVEMVERFSYYGTTTIFTNFIQHPRPEGSPSGAGYEGQSGAMGMGQQASTGLTLFHSFFAYLMPLLGGYLSDTYWGKFKTINVGIASATFGHVLIVISAIPAVLNNQRGSLAAFIIGLLFFGVGVGFFKANISPLIAEQYEAKAPRATIQTLPSGERVIVDPHKTYAIIYMRYYFFINVGVLFGQVSMVYAEKYVGFWLAYLLPTILFFLCPIVMVVCRNKYVKNPPTGSVASKATGLWALAMKKHWSWNPVRTVRNMRSADFWEAVKPSRLGDNKPDWMTFDDNWVDEVRRGFCAAKVFLFYPIFWLPYNQLYNNLTSQAATMRLDGFPNDLVNNLDPIALLIFIPLFDKFFYPWMDRARIRVTPIRKIAVGFIMAVLAMIVATLIQHYIYVQSPCGINASSCDTPPDISVWVQTPAYVLIAFSEIGASITGLEYAFTKAPKNMRGLVTGLFWFAQAFSAALAQAFVPFAKDPLLVWLYTTIAIITTLGGIGFWVTFRKLDREEEELNALPDSVFVGKQNKEVIDIEAAKAVEMEQQKLRHIQGLDKRLQETAH